MELFVNKETRCPVCNINLSSSRRYSCQGCQNVQDEGTVLGCVVALSEWWTT